MKKLKLSVETGQVQRAAPVRRCSRSSKTFYDKET